MRLALLIIVLPLFITSCGNSSQQTKDEANDTQDTENVVVAENLKTLILDVHGMTCTGCEEAVQGGVSALAGVTDVKASHTDSLAIVSFDPGQTSVEEIQNAIAGVGYTVAGFKFKEEEQE